MREIKFRAWDSWWGKMYYFDFTKNIEATPDDELKGLWILHEEGSVYAIQDKIKIMQFTGLKDKDCVEIYDGDIVRVMDSTFAIVKYSDDRGAYYLDCGKKIGDVGLICQYDTIKRVGNVYETPELLEVEE